VVVIATGGMPGLMFREYERPLTKAERAMLENALPSRPIEPPQEHQTNDRMRMPA
jgi:hypothetical protein